MGPSNLEKESSPALRLGECLQEIFILTVIVGFIEPLRSHSHADCAGREVVDVSPDHRRNVKAVIGTIQMEGFFGTTVIQRDIETARHRHEELLEDLVGVAGPMGATRDIVKV